MLETRRSMRCEGPSLAGSSTLSMTSSRSGAASMTVPSTVRSRPSDNAATSGADAGCGSISAHHAPSRHHITAVGSHTSARRAKCCEATERRDRSERNQHQAGPQPRFLGQDNSNSKQPCCMEQGDRARPCKGRTRESGPGGMSVPMALRAMLNWFCDQAYQARRSRTTVSRWNVCGNRSASVTESMA